MSTLSREIPPRMGGGAAVALVLGEGGGGWAAAPVQKKGHMRSRSFQWPLEGGSITTAVVAGSFKSLLESYSPKPSPSKIQDPFEQRLQSNMTQCSEKLPRKFFPAILTPRLLGKIIGEGGFASVRAFDHKTRSFAVKKLGEDYRRYWEEGCSGDKKALIREPIIACTIASHPNIVRAHCLLPFQDYYGKACQVLVMDRVGTPLLKKIDTMFCLKKGLTPDDFEQRVMNIRKGAMDLVLALKHLHDQGIIYRDLKPQNIQLAFKNSQEGFLLKDLQKPFVLKLIDFGFARYEETSSGLAPKEGEKPRERSLSLVGTPNYTSLEVSLLLSSQRPSDLRDYDGIKNDMWTLGATLYVLSLNHLPMAETVKRINWNELSRVKKKHLEYPPNYPPNLKSLIESLMNRDLSKRPTTNEIMQHPFFKE